MIHVAGYCPMGCGQTLFLGEAASVVCSAPSCPRPAAVTEILTDPETDHVVEVTEDGWQGLHPLRERLDGELLSCDLSQAMLDGLPPPPGRYRVRLIRGPLPGVPAWAWDRLA